MPYMRVEKFWRRDSSSDHVTEHGDARVWDALATALGIPDAAATRLAVRDFAFAIADHVTKHAIHEAD